MKYQIWVNKVPWLILDNKTIWNALLWLVIRHLSNCKGLSYIKVVTEHLYSTIYTNQKFVQVRQNYIRRRLLTTYRALERLSQSEFNLDRLELAASAAAAASSANKPSSSVEAPTVHLTVPGAAPVTPSTQVTTLLRVVKQRSSTNKNLPLTVTDVERERGKPLSKYDRNMMIFNWLHTLDEAPVETQWCFWRSSIPKICASIIYVRHNKYLFISQLHHIQLAQTLFKGLVNITFLNIVCTLRRVVLCIF